MVLCWAILAAQLVLLATIITSWFSVQPGTAMESVARGLRSVTDTALGPLRGVLRQIPLGRGTVDLTPLIVLIVLFVVRVVIGC